LTYTGADTHTLDRSDDTIRKKVSKVRDIRTGAKDANIDTRTVQLEKQIVVFKRKTTNQGRRNKKKRSEHIAKRKIKRRKRGNCTRQFLNAGTEDQTKGAVGAVKPNPRPGIRPRPPTKPRNKPNIWKITMSVRYMLRQ
jgi:hypothetical protein